MHWDIRPLTPERADEYFDFFENRAFTDDSPYRCYCQAYQMTQAEANAARGAAAGAEAGRLARRTANEQIMAGQLHGYLAYADGIAIGWCNAADRAHYPIDAADAPYAHAPEQAREMAVMCFEIAPGFRGRGVASALLERVVKDAGAQGYAAVVGFPMDREERFEWDCYGPLRLYEKAGFSRAGAHGQHLIMRRELV